MAILLGLLLANLASAQHHFLSGRVTLNGEPLAYATIGIPDTEHATFTDETGSFTLSHLDTTSFILEVHYVGLETTKVQITPRDFRNTIGIHIENSTFKLKPVEVVTGTRTSRLQTNNPVLVQVLQPKTLKATQSCNLSEGLRFQPGLRVETNCQTCNYTQLRMNGLAGGYSQILVNGRPVFSPLTGLYGLEQLPTSLIERIEVVRGGGSSLYGSSAIGGTVNVITKLPDDKSLKADFTQSIINQQTTEEVVNAYWSTVNAKKNAGVNIIGNQRFRKMYDHNNDNFSELPELSNTAISIGSFYKPSSNEKLEVNLTGIREYRYGGEITTKPTELSAQAEERTQRVFMATVDYQRNWVDSASLIVYSGYQLNNRDHYTGILPDDTSELTAYTANPPFGTSVNNSLTTGIQYNWDIARKRGNKHVLTSGLEYIYNEVLDQIPAYSYLIDQETHNVGLFAQSDWEVNPKLSLLSGIRFDYHNLLENIVANPRISLLVKPTRMLRYRFSYGEGFRAPQAFDADMHIASAGGGISRITLAPNLEQERSRSFNASVTYDKMFKKTITGFTVNGFYTQLTNAFTLENIGEDAIGEQFEKRNGDNADVYGVTLEYRLNYNKQFQLESGFTLQESRFENPVTVIDGFDPESRFMRTPNLYGFASLDFDPNKKWDVNVNYVFTGPMLVPHFGGAPNQPTDEIIQSESFHSISLRIERSTNWLKNSESAVYVGLKNVLNSYQTNFDIGKNRDSGFVYGPALPRTFFVGLSVDI